MRLRFSPALLPIALVVSLVGLVVESQIGRAQVGGPALGTAPLPGDVPSAALTGAEAPPPLPTADAEAPAGAEVMTRGPVHEAFASPLELNPQAGPIAPRRPPEPIQEIPPDQQPEGENIAWIPGYWSWDDEKQDFLWISGVLRNVPPYQTWVPGYWNEVGNGFQWTPGFWAGTANADVEYLPQPPQSQENGPNSPSPSDNHFWIPGNWVYQNTNYVWQPGYWSVCRPNWIWVPAHYVWTPGGFVFTGGYWDFALARRGCLFAPLYFAQPVYAQPAFVYTPRVLINVGLFGDCLFARPSFCSYYFGDYFAPSYVGFGFRPWFSLSFGGRPCYDPLFTYYRWNNSRGDRNWLAHTQQHYDLLRTNEAARPPHTLLAQQQLLRTNAGRSGPNANTFAMASSLKTVASESAKNQSAGAIKFHTVSQADRQQLVAQGKELQQVTVERSQLENKRGDAGLGNGKSGLGRGDGNIGDNTTGNNTNKFKLPTAAASKIKLSNTGDSSNQGSGDVKLGGGNNPGSKSGRDLSGIGSGQFGTGKTGSGLGADQNGTGKGTSKTGSTAQTGDSGNQGNQGTGRSGKSLVPGGSALGGSALGGQSGTGAKSGSTTGSGSTNSQQGSGGSQTNRIQPRFNFTPGPGSGSSSGVGSGQAGTGSTSGSGAGSSGASGSGNPSGIVGPPINLQPRGGNPSGAGSGSGVGSGAGTGSGSLRGGSGGGNPGSGGGSQKKDKDNDNDSKNGKKGSSFIPPQPTQQPDPARQKSNNTSGSLAVQRQTYKLLHPETSNAGDGKSGDDANNSKSEEEKEVDRLLGKTGDSGSTDDDSAKQSKVKSLSSGDSNRNSMPQDLMSPDDSQTSPNQPTNIAKPMQVRSGVVAGIRGGIQGGGSVANPTGGATRGSYANNGGAAGSYTPSNRSGASRVAGQTSYGPASGSAGADSGPSGGNLTSFAPGPRVQKTPELSNYDYQNLMQMGRSLSQAAPSGGRSGSAGSAPSGMTGGSDYGAPSAVKDPMGSYSAAAGSPRPMNGPAGLPGASGLTGLSGLYSGNPDKPHGSGSYIPTSSLPQLQHMTPDGTNSRSFTGSTGRSYSQ